MMSECPSCYHCYSGSQALTDHMATAHGAVPTGYKKRSDPPSMVTSAATDPDQRAEDARQAVNDAQANLDRANVTTNRFRRVMGLAVGTFAVGVALLFLSGPLSDLVPVLSATSTTMMWIGIFFIPLGIAAGVLAFKYHDDAKDTFDKRDDAEERLVQAQRNLARAELNQINHSVHHGLGQLSRGEGGQ